jgi:hypothetical protein
MSIPYGAPLTIQIYRRGAQRDLAFATKFGRLLFTDEMLTAYEHIMRTVCA